LAFRLLLEDYGFDKIVVKNKLNWLIAVKSYDKLLLDPTRCIHPVLEAFDEKSCQIMSTMRRMGPKGKSAMSLHSRTDSQIQSLDEPDAIWNGNVNIPILDDQSITKQQKPISVRATEWVRERLMTWEWRVQSLEGSSSKECRLSSYFETLEATKTVFLGDEDVENMWWRMGHGRMDETLCPFCFRIVSLALYLWEWSIYFLLLIISKLSQLHDFFFLRHVYMHWSAMFPLYFQLREVAVPVLVCWFMNATQCWDAALLGRDEPLFNWT